MHNNHTIQMIMSIIKKTHEEMWVPRFSHFYLMHIFITIITPTHIHISRAQTQHTNYSLFFAVLFRMIDIIISNEPFNQLIGGKKIQRKIDLWKKKSFALVFVEWDCKIIQTSYFYSIQWFPTNHTKSLRISYDFSI